MTKKIVADIGSRRGSESAGVTITAEGWCLNVRRVPSPNCSARLNDLIADDQAPAETEISLLVIHNISLPPGEFGGPYIEQLFTNCLSPQVHPYFVDISGLEVSAHLLIDRQGECVQFVSFDEQAWHAGESCFDGRHHCNEFAIGIELEGTDTSGYTDLQYAVLAKVTRALRDRYPAITRTRIVGHSDIAPGRKTDPGPGFNWQQFEALVGS